MLRPTLVLAALTCMAGCAATGQSSRNSAKMATAEPTSEQLAAYAGRHAFPSTQPAQDNLRAAAIISRDHKTLKVYNFSKEPIPESEVWINGAYVTQIPGVAPQSNVDISTKRAYNAFGQNFSETSEPVSRVQIKTDQGLYNALGPATE